MIKYVTIKKDLTKIVKKVRDIDVYYSTIEKRSPDIKSYYHISLIPIITQLHGKELRNRSLLIDISYFKEKASQTDYFEWHEDIEASILPCIQIDDRFITIEDATFKVVDGVAHYVFSIKFRDCVDQEEEAPQSRSTGELQIDII